MPTLGGSPELHPEASDRITPKVFIITFFSQEATHWLSDSSTIKLTKSITVPGLSHGYSKVHYTTDRSICLMTTGIALVNAALSISALTHSPLFNLTKTYFLLSGIAGVNPQVSTIGSVALARFAVQIDIQLAFDARDLPASWQQKSGFLPIGARKHGELPPNFTGSEIFELNDNLRQLVLSFAREAEPEFVDSEAAKENRSMYAGSERGIYDRAAYQKPSVISGDVTSSNIFFHGHHLASSFSSLVSLYTANQARYTMTAMEDTAILAALLRAAMQKKVDFKRVVLMRAGSNFDRSWRGDGEVEMPFVVDRGGFEVACRNLWVCGVRVVEGIVGEWETFEKGVEAGNYVGDVFGSLGGRPGFGPMAMAEEIPSSLI